MLVLHHLMPPRQTSNEDRYPLYQPHVQSFPCLSGRRAPHCGHTYPPPCISLSNLTARHIATMSPSRLHIRHSLVGRRPRSAPVRSEHTSRCHTANSKRLAAKPQSTIHERN